MFDSLGRVDMIESKERDIKTEMEEHLRQVIKRDREDQVKRLRTIKRIYSKELRKLRQTIAELRAIAIKQAGERPGEAIAQKLMNVKKIKEA